MTHGDAWTNNFMFKHDESNKPMDLLLIDFQMSCYASPTIDLHYFFIATAHNYLDKEYNNFLLYYHTELVNNLKKLQYKSHIPTLRELNIDMIRTGVSAACLTLTGLPIFLLDPSDDASVKNYQAQTKEGDEFRTRLYQTPRYIKALEVVLPFLNAKGLFDLSDYN